MSIFWDPRARKPQMWVYIPFVLIAIVVFLAIYNYGNSKADKAEMEAGKHAGEAK